jgi:hypothetical protein
LTADALERVADRTESLIAEIRELAHTADDAETPGEVSSAGFKGLNLIDQVQSYLARDGRKLAEDVASFSFAQGAALERLKSN